jgi:hypothetical protein
MSPSSSFSTPRYGSGRARLALAVFLLLCAALMPERGLRYATWLARPVEAIMAPWRNVLWDSKAWIQRRTTPIQSADAGEVHALRQKLDEALFALNQSNSQVLELRQRIRDLARSQEINPIPVDPVPAPVIGAAADISSRSLLVRAGRRERVESKSVAVVRGVHLVGHVGRVEDRTCVVLPITDPAAGMISGRIMLEDSTPGPLCLLEPDGRGRLRGPVQDDPTLRDPVTAQAAEIGQGQIVRLEDRKWPQSAQMLVIGRVVGIEPLPNQPLRKIVTVEPVEPIERVSEVTIRVPISGADVPAAPPTTREQPAGGRP